METKEFKRWIEEVVEHEERINYREAYFECIEGLVHPRYEAFLSERCSEAGHKLCKMVADGERNLLEEKRLSARRSVFTRVLHKFREGGK